ncbi:AAA family ATPase [Pseudomonas triticifolii]|uniref:AAA family ATPase n=1 Tax=Pseudomonas triticifolii TaxID=2762592 RepID=A0ABR7BG51_9PSED|nr:AAA family ATPase [Pseudomonas triticifolii]MBC3956154.1 AAA family ATPase [Pseudomonas triticifolii]
MRGIRLNTLDVSHFRGLNDSVRFDFSSPLTVVYAPNGTGKTTMCEAAEWLLTGQVERLKEGNGFDALVLSPKFPSQNDATTSAAASLYIDGTEQYVRRYVDGSQSSAAYGADEGAAVTLRPNELLALLAPVAAADEAHAITAINLRQRWLKGTRFLSSEALAALVDTDEETIERRTQVFADLLGIRHLLDAERQCEKYIVEIGRRLRNLTKMTESRSAEVTDLELALGPDEAAGTSHSSSARLEADTAANLFVPEDTQWFVAQPNLDDQLASLTALHSRYKHLFDARSNAAKRVEAKWSIRSSLEMAVTEGINIEAALAQSLAQIEKDGRQAATELSDFNSRREATYLLAQELAKAKDELTHLGAMVVATLLDGGFADDLSLSLIELSHKYSEYQWPASARQQRRHELKGLELSSAGSSDETKRLAELDLEVSAARSDAPSREELEHLQEKAAETVSHAKAATKLLDAVASPVARLQAAARELLNHDHGVDIGKCPLCSHDWKDAENLRSAINATLSAAPELVVAARSGVAAADDAATLAHSQLNAALQKQKYLLGLEKEQSDLQLANAVQDRELERLGVSQGATAEEFKSLAAHLDVADAISVLLSARDGILPTVFGSEFRMPASGFQVADLHQHLDTVFEARHRVVQLELAELAKSIEAAISNRDDLRAKYAAAQQNLKDCRLGLEQKSAELASLQSAWQEASPGIEWSNAELDTLMSELTKENVRLTVIEGHITAARAAWAAESRRSRLLELQQATQLLIDESRVMTGRLDAANRARAVFYEAYTTISRQKVQDLSRVVNPLFARMHANRVFDRINLGADTDFLHWLADAGDQQLDPGKDFSQGQRQDLALALFLARARSLGGTFFLDEPIVHLDDLNRVGLLDILRATVLESSNTLNLVITTSSRALARHLIEKFAGVGLVETPSGRQPPLRILELDGNGRSGIRLSTVYPLEGLSAVAGLGDEIDLD